MTMPRPATPEELAAIKAREKKATPGPWISFGNKGDQPDDTWGNWSVDSTKDELDLRNDPRRYREPTKYENRLAIECISDNIYTKEDAEFIAHAREDIPKLLRTIEAKDAEIEKLQIQVVRLHGALTRYELDAFK